MDKEFFFNFPIQLLRFSPNMHVVGNIIIAYATYRHALTLLGSDEERMIMTCNYFNLPVEDISEVTKLGKMLKDRLPERSPMTGINKELLLSFMKGSQSLQEIAVLSAHLAIKSILGKKPYCRITTDFLLCRMAGYSSLSDIDELPEYLKPYTTRRRMDGIKAELQRSYGVKIYGRYTRGYFVTERLSLEELITEVELKRKKNWLAQQKAELEATRAKVLNNLNT